MARKREPGLEYYPRRTSQSDIIKLLRYNYGDSGELFWIYLQDKIYNGSYFIKWKEANIKLFCKENYFEYKLVKNIMEFLFENQLLDKDLYSKYEILTSYDFQITYNYAMKSKNIVEYESKYLLITKNDIKSSIVRRSQVFSIKNENVILVIKLIKNEDGKFEIVENEEEYYFNEKL